MSKCDGLSISLFSALANGVKLLAGPITLLFISKNLDSEQIGFYYTFFSLVAMQQLAELGIGHTLKQFIAHSYKIKNDNWTEESRRKIRAYIGFGFRWFSLVALFIIIIVGPVGWFYYSSYSGSVDWLSPWFILIVASALITSLTPVQILLEATQNQKKVYQAQSITALINSIAVWVFISMGAGLYTIPLALIMSNIVFYSLLSYHSISLYRELCGIVMTNKASDVFKELWPLLSKVSIVWGAGFLFWNGFNLVAFKIYTSDYAGKVIFTIALARAGFGLADSFFSSQITVIAYKISQGHIKQAKEYARKYQIIALLILTSGYSAFCILKSISPELFLFKKMVDLNYCFSVFLFFISVLILVTQNNFIRCFKVEPFVLVSVFQSVAVPLTFYTTNSFGYNLYFYPCIIVMCLSIFVSYIVSQRFLASRGIEVVYR